MTKREISLCPVCRRHPVHSPEYICCKLILRPNKFHSRESFFEFGKVFKEPAKEHGVKYSVAGFESQPVKLREVVFGDTEDFRPCNNASILRRRIPYKDGFPIWKPEIVFKFRHPDLHLAGKRSIRASMSVTLSLPMPTAERKNWTLRECNRRMPPSFSLSGTAWNLNLTG